MTPKSRRASVLVIGGTPIGRALVSAAANSFCSVERASDRADSGRVVAADVVLLAAPKLDDMALHELERLAQIRPGRPLLVLVERATEREAVAALKAGASGLVHESDGPARIVAVLRASLEGGVSFSGQLGRMVLDRARRPSTQLSAVRRDAELAERLGPRKLEILQLLGGGHSYDSIAVALGLSVNTVRSHVKQIYARLGVASKAEAVRVAVEAGLLGRRGP